MNEHTCMDWELIEEAVSYLESQSLAEISQQKSSTSINYRGLVVQEIYREIGYVVYGGMCMLGESEEDTTPKLGRLRQFFLYQKYLIPARKF